jgi:hypothetical protein
MNNYFSQPPGEQDEAVSPLELTGNSGQFFQQSGAFATPARNSQQSGAFPIMTPGQPHFYEQEEDPGLSSAFPSLGSGFTGMQPAHQSTRNTPPVSSAATRRSRQRVPRVVGITILVVLLLLLVPVVVYAMFFSGGSPVGIRIAPTSTSRNTSFHGTHSTTPTGRHHPPTPIRTVATGVATTPTTGTGGSLLQTRLPTGWGNRNPIDAQNALLEAWTFTQREMRIDFQSVGTQAQPGGTLTGSVFLLTPAAQQRFKDNDKRSSAAFFVQIQNTQLIQIPVFDNPPFVSHMQILQAQAQGGAFFVWVTVPFELAIQHGVGGQPVIDLNQQTQQPRQYTMQVLLMSVPVGTGPMGGIDYEVSDYALDMQQGPLPIPTQP